MNYVWNPAPKGIGESQINNILDEIQQIRTRNNENWMAIMRLAFKHAPDASKQIMKKIAKCDRKINELTKELIE